MVVASLVDTLSKIGAIGGIVSFIGVGLMILLVASQARQIRSMREWIDAEPERQAEVAQRVIAEVQRRIAAARERRAAQAAQPPVAPAPAGGARQVPPAPGTLGATPEARAVAAAKSPDAITAAPGEEAASSDTAAPGAATPAESAAPGSADAPPVFAPLAPVAGAEQPPGDPVAGGDAPLSAADEPAVVAQFGQETQPADALPPDYDPFGASTPAAAHRADASFDEHFAFDEEQEEEAPRGNRLLFGIGAAALLAGIVVAVYVLVGGGSDTSSPAKISTADDTHSASSSDASASKTSATTPTTIDRSTIRVTVLNGTTVNGLAQTVSDKLAAKDYTVGQPNTLSSDAAVAASFVQYRPGSGNVTKAREVAKDLDIPSSSVQPIDANVSVAAPQSSVIVVVTGQDLASTVSGTSG
ncbi:MAG: LytR C-terminal domain-containing protein [Patulibacter sp.]